MNFKKSKIIKITISIFVLCIIAIVIIISLFKGNDKNKNDTPHYDHIVEIDDKTVRLTTGATITIYKSDEKNSNGRAVIIIPGGAYKYVAGNYEGADWAPLLNKLGYTSAVLKYTVLPKSPDDPLNETLEAMKYLRNNNKWNVNTNIIGVMGFSAGGHIVSTVATHTSGEDVPDFQILFYPVISMDSNYISADIVQNFLGRNPSNELVNKYSNEKHVNANTPPAYITWADNDNIVPPINSIDYIDALNAKGIPVHSARLDEGGHGYGFNPFRYHDFIVDDLTKWLEDLDKTFNVTQNVNKRDFLSL